MCDVPERVVQRVLAGVVIDEHECWIWRGAKYGGGYGHVAWQKNNIQAHRSTHRVLYQAMIGPVPDGFDLDHL